MSRHIFLDCDGVLADFNGRVKLLSGRDVNRDFGGALGTVAGAKELWDIIGADGDFYAKLEPLPDAQALYEAVRHLEPTIITGVPHSYPWAEPQKRDWANRHFPGVPVITCPSAEKRLHMKARGDVLIDDWAKYRHLWDQAGGHFILHTSTETSLNELWTLCPELEPQ